MSKVNFVVGDVHGCFQEYLELEAKINKYARKNDLEPFIISVGDLVDRGPQSGQLLEHFKMGCENGSHAVVMGNHEQMMLETLYNFAPENFYEYPSWFSNYKKSYERRKGSARYLSWQDYAIMIKSMWLTQGGFQTLQSLGCDPLDTKTWRLPRSLIEFMLDMPFFWENDKFVVTHALAKTQDLTESIRILNLMKSKQTIEEDLENFSDITRSLIWNRDVQNTPIHKTKTHISGHTPIPRVKRYRKANCIQIDTACVFGGTLTAYCLELNKLITVKSRQNYFS